MKKITLTKGKFALVDADEFASLNQWKWYFHQGYAARGDKSGGKNKIVLMHRQIAGTPEGFDTDHINGDRLDNRKANLRICTRAQNNMNRQPISGKSSKYKGVSWAKREQKWRASISVNNKAKHLGYFDNQEKAALAYNNAAIKHSGEFSILNEVKCA